MNFIYVHGMPASGKDTQARIITENTPRAVLISPGEIYRNIRKPQSEYHTLIDLVSPYLDRVDRGEIVPEEITMQLVAETIDNKSRQGFENFIFTGFPRTLRQLKLLDEYTHLLKETWAGELNETHIAYIVRESDASQRAEGRKKSSSAQTERIDDRPETVRRRFEVYREQTYPMLRKLSEEGRLTVIRGDRGIEHVRKQTEGRLQALAGSPEKR